jgi:tetratricopeptide (TPR) repeat protein
VEQVPLEVRPQIDSVGLSASALEQQWLDAEVKRLRASGPDGEERALDLYKQVIEVQFDAKRYDEALAAIDKTLKLRPQAYALAKKGEILRQRGGEDCLRESVAVLEEAIRLEPEDGWAHIVYAETLRMLNRVDDAAAEFKRAVEIDPTIDDWHYRRADFLRALDRLPDALASLDDALRCNPSNVAALSMRGEVLRGMGRTADALADFDRSLELRADDPWTLASKGYALRDAGKLADAVQTLKQAIDLQGGVHPWAETALGNVRLDQNREAEALRCFEQVLQRDPTYTWALEGKARALMQLDQIERCLELCRQLLEFESLAAWAQGVIGVLMFHIEEYAQGIEALERSTQTDAKAPWSHNALANCYVWLARSGAPTETERCLDRAIAEAAMAVELDPKDSSWRVTRAEALLRRSRNDAAADEFDKALEFALGRKSGDYYAAYDAGWAAYRLALLKPQEATRFLSQAEQSFVEALTLKTERPDSSDVVSVKFNLALVMLCTGRFALALRELDSASNLAGTLEPALYRGLLGRAKAGVAEAIELWPSLRESAHAQKALSVLEKRYDTPPSRQVFDVEGSTGIGLATSY